MTTTDPDAKMEFVMPSTRWKLVQVTDLAGRPRRNLDILVTVGTTAPSVIGAIERAAAAAGVILQPILTAEENGNGA